MRFGARDQSGEVRIPGGCDDEFRTDGRLSEVRQNWHRTHPLDHLKPSLVVPVLEDLLEDLFCCRPANLRVRVRQLLDARRGGR
jgi:hypothetical protein